MNPIEELLQKHCPEGVEFKPLSEICTLQAGDRIIKSMMSENASYPVYGGGTVPTGYYHDYNFNQGITIARAGSAGYVSWQEGKFWATDVCFVATLSRRERAGGFGDFKGDKGGASQVEPLVPLRKEQENILLKFVFYVLKNSQHDLQKHLYGGTLPKLDKNYLWTFPIPLPPLIVQEKIVEILDKFDALAHSLSEGLPAEIKARKKQYEYYREKLLSFREKRVC